MLVPPSPHRPRTSVPSRNLPRFPAADAAGGAPLRAGPGFPRDRARISRRFDWDYIAKVGVLRTGLHREARIPRSFDWGYIAKFYFL